MNLKISDIQNNKNIHKTYDSLRLNSPIYFSPDGPVLFTKHEDVIKILKNKNLSKNIDVYAKGKSEEYIRPFKELKNHLPQMGKFKTLLRMDGEEHDALKMVLAPMFSKSAAVALKESIEEIIEETLEELGSLRQFDVVSEFTKKVPVRVISKMLEIDSNMNDFLYEWSEALSAIIEPSMSKKDVDKIVEVGPIGFFHFIDVLTNDKKYRHSKLVKEILKNLPDSKGFTFENRVSVIALLYIAGVETLTYTISNAVYDLIKNPNQIELICSYKNMNQDEQETVVAEILRYSASVHQSVRVATDNIEFESQENKVTIPDGSIINAVLVAANRDPEVFENPHVLDLKRSNAVRHVSFSAGPHYCLGANMAKLEIPLALCGLFTRFPNLQIDSEPTYRDRQAITGINRLIVNT